ncbi:diguanylate cyclase (GGDEF)-like protein [Luteibacter jiangsuensis]|uniref:diguanylate cyclase n=1 Tax=Luteibacter jiangsuensis TaxID=637577 RepID=A0ABT9SUB8_9GAMM|nr:GGDEF domain-containing protein [Luteibacter jiangsuensis]MDQ0008583.1 diguanylate cyclase (GGDEF)-like protein [Luteibacter jiangsuensis]
MGTTRRYLGYAVACLALPVAQVVAPPLAGRELPELAYYLMLFASGAACLAALACLRVPTYERRTMVCLALGLACWFAGMAYAIARSGAEENLISTYVLFVSYGVPLLYAAVSTRDEPSMLSRRIVDGSLLILLVILCYLGVRDLRDANGFLKNEDMVWVVVAFDVENVFLFLTFVIRSLTATEEREHRFFRLTATFLGLYAIAAGIHNHDELHPNLPIFQQLADVLPTVPFVALICLLHAQRHRRPFEPTRHRWARQLSVSLAPGLLLAAIFALSLGISETQRTFGRVVLALAMLAYVVRVTQTQFWFARTRDMLSEALAAVERVSLLDELTGIPNRRAFDQALAERTKEAAREGKPLSALMIDVDLFKTFNDTRGHPAGDVALSAVARLLAGTLRRPTDFIARYGGEEFVALLPGADRLGAQVVARRMNRAIYDAQLEHTHGIDGRVTVSIGVATGLPPDVQSLVREADQALYVAKSSGRNRHVSANEALEPG